MGKPSVGVPTLHAVAFGAGPSPMTLAMTPAGRGELFAQLLAVTTEGEIAELTTAVHLPQEKLLQEFASISNLRFASSGATAAFDFFQTKGSEFGRTVLLLEQGEDIPQDPNGVWCFSPAQHALSTSVGRIAARVFGVGQTLPVGDLLPNYVRPSDPELKLLCR